MLLLILFLAVCLVTMTLAVVSGKRGVIAGKIIVSVLILFIVGFGVCFGAVLIAFSPHWNFYANMLLIAGIIIAALLIATTFGVIKKKYVWIPLVSLLLINAAVTGVFYDWHNAETISEGQDLLDKYEPYADNTVVVELEEEANFKIESDYPRLDGATALYPIYSAFAKAVYPQEVLEDKEDRAHYNNELLQCTTTTQAYKKIVDGTADMIFVAAPSEEQEKYAYENGVELIFTPIGKEAFVFFVNARNKLDDITVEQIQKIYSGEITTWEELGIKHLGEIKAFQRDEGSGSQSALIRLMNGKELMTPPKEDVINAMGGIISETADYKNHRNAIGYSFRFYSTEMVKNKKIKLLSMNGIEPTIENIENGTYPIASNFYAVTRSDASENTKKLLEWILSEQGQEIIRLTGYTPVK